MLNSTPQTGSEDALPLARDHSHQRHLPLHSSEKLVRFIDVSKTFDGETNVVNGLNLDIRKGEFLTFLGPSGSGKTTTLLMLAGFETPTRGDIQIQGTSIVTTPPHKRNFGMVFQNYALFPHMTVLENVAFPLVVRGVNKVDAARRATKALDLVQLEKFGSRLPSQLSGGQQQRAALARALVFDPELVLMDEPFGALDKKLRESMQMEVKQIHARLGNSMISVTHDQSEALTMSDRIAVFSNGEIQQIAEPADIYERPANEFVARFVGDINLTKGSIASISGDECSISMAQGVSAVALTIDGMRVGKHVTLCIRPEKLVFGQLAERSDNTLEGQVEEVVYWGDHVRIFMRLPDGSQWIGKSTQRFGSDKLAIGSTVRFGWSKQDATVLSN